MPGIVRSTSRAYGPAPYNASNRGKSSIPPGRLPILVTKCLQVVAAPRPFQASILPPDPCAHRTGPS